MNLAEVMDEIAAALQQITGLNVFPYPPGSITPPAGYVSYPRPIRYDEVYDHGGDEFTDLPVVLLAGRASDLSARDKVSGWCDPAHPDSVKRALERWPWKSCDDIHIGECEFDVETIGGVGYLAANFKATVVGPGE